MTPSEPMSAPSSRKGRFLFPGWYVVFGAMTIHFTFSFTYFYGFSAFFEPITRHFGWPRTLTSGAFSLQQVEMGLSSPVSGFLVDRFGARKVSLVGVLLFGLGLLALSLIQAAWQYYLCILATSMGATLCLTSFPAATINWFRRRRGRALGVMSCGPVLSGLFVPLVVVLVKNLGWRGALSVLAVTSWAIGLPAAMLLRHRPEPYGYLPDGDTTPPEALPRTSPAQTSTPGLTVRQALRSQAFWLLAVVIGVHQMGPSAVFIVQIPYFESLGFSPEVAASTVGVFTVLSGIGRLGSGFLLDTLDRRLMLTGVLAADCLGLLVLVNITEYWMVIPFGLLFGIGFGGMQPTRNVLISDYFGTRNFASIYGLLTSVHILFGIAAPLMVGFSADFTGSYKPAFLAVCALIALCLPLPWVLRRPKQS